MKMVAIMFSYTKRGEVLHRPNYMLVSRYDCKRKRFSRCKIIPLRHSQLPEDIADLLTNPGTYTIVWTEDEACILQALLAEMGIDIRTVRIGLITGYLKAHNIPNKSLTQTAQALGASHHCPRECVQSLEKVKNRFDVLRRVIRRLIKINDIILIDGILI